METAAAAARASDFFILSTSSRWMRRSARWRLERRIRNLVYPFSPLNRECPAYRRERL
jgi:hypothetical protein